MGTFAALALTMNPASPAMLNRMPDRKTAPLFSVDMGKIIIGQPIYQTFVVLLFHFGGAKFWGYTSERKCSELSPMVFNTFVFGQIFNSINCRSLTNDKNIFRGLPKNWYLIMITLIGEFNISTLFNGILIPSVLQRLPSRFSSCPSAVRRSRSR